MNVLARYRVGRKVAAHVFAKSGYYWWNEGSPSDNVNAHGHDYSLSVNAYLNALNYAKSWAEYIGCDTVKVAFYTGETTVWKYKNHKWVVGVISA